MGSSTFSKERWAALAGAILLTIALPIAIDQGYFRYNPYVLPGLGGFAVLLYLGFFLSSSRAVSIAKRFRHGFCARHRIFGMISFITIFGVLGCLFGAAWYMVLGKSKEHVTDLLKKETKREPSQVPAKVETPLSSSASTTEQPEAVGTDKAKGTNLAPPVHKIPPPIPTAVKPAPKDEAIVLAHEIDKWAQPKFKERSDYADARRPQKDTLTSYSEYDQKTPEEFKSKFSARLTDVLGKLDRCNANTVEVKKSMQDAYRLEHFLFIGMNLQEAAHTIPEGQPECGTGKPTKGFGERDTGLYMLLMGSEEVGYRKEDLERGAQAAGTMTIGGKHTFKIYLRNGIFCIDAKVYGGFGMPLIDVACNRIKEPPNGWDINYTDKAMEVVDQNQVPMFQMIFEGERRIRVNGVFLGDNELFINTPQGGKRVKLNPNNKTPIEIPLKPLFKYPSWKFPHQYVE